MALRDVDVLGGDGLHLVQDVALAIEDLRWGGLAAALSITSASGILPGLFLEDMSLDVAWSEPVLEVQGAIVADVGRVAILGATVDAAAKTGEVSVAITGRRAVVTERFAPAGLRPWLRGLTGDPRIELHAGLDAQGRAAVELGARLPGLVEAVVVGGGAVQEAPDLELTSRVEIAAAALPEPALAPSGSLRPVLQARIVGESWESLRAELRLRCVGCGELGGLDLWAEGTRAPDGEVAGEVRLAAAGVALEAGVEARLETKEIEETGDKRASDGEADGGAQAGGVDLRAARWELRIPAIAATAGAVGQLASLPALSGRLTSAGRCEGEALRCDGKLALDDFAGAGVRLGSLRGEVSGEPLGDPLTLEASLAARDLVVDAADLRLAGVDVDARFGPSTEIEGAQMVAASIDAWVKRRGAGDHASIAAAVHLGSPLRIALDRLELAYRGLQARLRAPTRATIGERRYAVDDLDLALAGGRIKADGAVDRDGASDLAVDIDALHLEKLAKLAPGLRGRIGGSLSADLDLKGPAEAPVITASVDGRGLR
ncbi:MAG: hypothetical protein KC486_33410, partial [Myxococcales bacterium]|nr:hypothetical protein [Myxococcales bacterium]